jgi:hypothetical protein
MNSMLSGLGVSAEIAGYFSDTFRILPDGSLCFVYGSAREYFVPGQHLVPVTSDLWRSNPLNPALISHVFIACSAMEAICFLHIHRHLFGCLDQLLFVATGLLPSQMQLAEIAKEYKRQKFALLMGNSLAGRAADVRIAGWLKEKNFLVNYEGLDQVMISFGQKEYTFSESAFNLNAFQVASGFRFKIRTYKSRLSDSFLDQLQFSHPAPLR